MKRNFRVIFSLLLIVAMVMTYSGISFAEDAPVDNPDGTPTATEPAETNPDVIEPTEGNPNDELTTEKGQTPDPEVPETEKEPADPAEPESELQNTPQPPAPLLGAAAGGSKGEEGDGSVLKAGEDEGTVTQYTVTFEANGGTVDGKPVEPVIVTAEESVELPVPSLAGYRFDGWFDEDNKIDSPYTPTGDITLTAKWTKIIKYTVKFNENGGKTVADVTVEEGQSVKMPATSRSGYTFGGWFDSKGNKIGSTYKPTSDITLTAKWTIIKTDLKDCTVTLQYSKAFFKEGSTYKPVVTVKTKKDNKTIARTFKDSVTGKEIVNYKVTYKNNDKAGVATVTITAGADGKLKGTAVTKEFKLYALGKVTGLAYKDGASDRKPTSINIKWDKFTKLNIKGYKIFVNDKLWKTIADPATVSYRISGLKANTKYKVEVATYAYDGNKALVIGPKTAATMWTTYVAPGKVKFTSAEVKKPYVKVNWKKASTYNTYAFQVQYSTDSDFTDPKYVIVVGNNATSKNVEGLKDDTKYYFRIRAIRKNAGGYSFGAWTGVRSRTANSTGWIKSNGRKYYFKNGRKVTGQVTIGKEPYYFDEETGEYHGASKGMWEKLKNSSSKTKYLVSISIKYHRVNVYKKNSGDWVPVYQWKCITGYFDTTKYGKKFTPRGSWLTSGKKLKSMSNDDHTCYYATNFCGRCYIHSELYAPRMTMKKVIDGKLGGSYSSGCVRLYIDNAIWVYNNIKKGTRVVSYRL